MNLGKQVCVGLFCAVIFLVASTVLSAADTNDLLLYYGCNTNNGYTVIDQSGSGYNGSISGATWIADGPGGGAYRFDGDDYINVGDVLNVGGDNDALTVCVWVRGSNPSQTMNIIGKNQSGSPYTGWSLRINNGNLCIADLVANYPQRSDPYVTNTVFDGEWHFLCGVFNVTSNEFSSQIYHDGNFIAEDAWTSSFDSTETTADLRIGNRAPANSDWYVGDLDEVQIYGRCLSSSEIVSIYNEGLGTLPGYGSVCVNIEPTNTVLLGAQWRLDSGSDTNWHSDGHVLAGLTTGDYDIVFNTIDSWVSPSSISITVVSEEQTNVVGVYTAMLPPEGSLRVDIIPSNAVADGAQWRLPDDNPTNWHSSEEVVSGLSTGRHRISFNTLSDWLSPDDLYVTILDGGQTNVAASYVYSPLSTNDLLLHYSCNTNSGSTVWDQSQSGYNGSISGATWIADGPGGGAYRFDGDDLIFIGDVLDVGGEHKTLTACVWVRGDNPYLNMCLIAKNQDDSPYSGWALRINGYHTCIADLIGSYPQRSDPIITDPSMFDGQWHFLCGVFSVTSNEFKSQIFYDGEFIAEDAWTGAFDSTETVAPLCLGNRALVDTEWYRGDMDEIRVYSRALSTSDIAAIYAEVSGTLPDEGRVRVDIQPTNAVLAGAQWRLSSGYNTNWHNSGEVVSGLATGNYTVLFSTISEWQDPSSVSITVVDDEQTNVVGVYTEIEPPTGSIRVDIAPSNAVLAGAQWRLPDENPTNWYNSAETVLGVLTGVHRVSFRAVEDWLVPDDLYVTVLDGAQTNVVGNYVYSPMSTNDLLLHYNCNSNSGSTVIDQSSSGYNGSISGATWIADGLGGGAYRFDGNDYIDVGDVLDIGRRIDALTVCVWVRGSNPLQTMNILGKNQTDSPYIGWALRINNYNTCIADLIASYPQRSDPYVSDAIFNGGWHFLCGVFSVTSNELKSQIYYDGDFIAEDVWASAFDSTETMASLRIGNRAPANSDWYVGDVDEVRIYGRCLSTSEIAEIYAEVSSNISDTASITVDIAPEQAVTMGAQWRLTSGSDTSWKDSGTSIIGLTGGTYTVSFKDVQSWLTPDDIIVALSSNLHTNITANYTYSSSTTNGLVLYYNFDEDQSVQVSDLSGSGYNGEIHGAEYHALGVIGGSYAFDGNDYISAGNILDLEGGRTALTACAWIKSSRADLDMCVLGKNQDFWPYTGWSLRINKGSHSIADLVASYPDRSDPCSTEDVLDSSWHFLCGVYEVTQDTIKSSLYIDGVFKSQDEVSGVEDTTETIAQFIVGDRDPGFGEPFVGFIDELRVFDRVLSESEIEGLYSLGSNTVPEVSVISVDLYPEAVNGAGAMWRLEMGPNTNWQASGDAVGGLTGESYTIQFKAVSGWNSPSSCIVSLPEPGSTNLDVLYTPLGDNTNDLVLYYDFDENEGAYVSDLSGSGYTGLVFGAQYVSLGECGGAYRFDGDDYISAGDVLDIGGLHTVLTACAWVKSSRADLHMCVLGKNQDSWPYTGWSLRINKGSHSIADLIASYPDRSDPCSTEDVLDASWHFLCGTYEVSDGTIKSKLYIDGLFKAQDEVTDVEDTTETTAELLIGGRYPNYSELFVGLIDDVRIYSRALSAGDIASLYASRPTCEPVFASISVDISPESACFAGAQWRLTDGPDNVWLNSGETIADLSPGTYTVAFKALSGWQSPGNQIVTLGSCEQTNLTAVYTSDSYSTNDLVLLYSFDDYEGETVSDLSGCGHHGTLFNTEHVSLDVCGGALWFNGSAYVDAGDVLDMTNNAARTVFVRMLGTLTEQENMCIVGKNQDDEPYTGWSLRINNGYMCLADLIADYPERASPIARDVNVFDGQWHVVCGVMEASDGLLKSTLYIDDNDAITQERSGSHSGVDTEASLRLGDRASGGGEPFIGLMDEVRIYERALSAAEVSGVIAQMESCAAQIATLTVNIEPTEVNNAGAMWRLMEGGNTNWMASGESLLGVGAGTNTVIFKELPGWDNAANTTLDIVAGTHLIVTGLYSIQSADYEAPSIVDVTPPSGYVGMTYFVPMNITVSDNSGIAGVTVNGEEATANSSSNYYYLLDGVNGSYNPANVVATDFAGNQTNLTVNYARACRIDLSFMWNGYWRVRNPYSTNLTYSWSVCGSSECGFGEVNASSDAYFNTSSNAAVVALYVNGVLKDIAYAAQVPPPPSMNVLDETLDSDADGVPNIAEEIAGSDANDENSVFELFYDRSNDIAVPAPALYGASKRDSSDVEHVLSWFAGSDSMYTIWVSADLNVWLPVLDFVNVRGSDNYMSYTNKLNDDLIFYRIDASKIQGEEAP